MKKNAIQREFKKLKSQITNIEEVIHNSKIGGLIEQESSVRKKIQLLEQMSDAGLKDYDEICDRYNDLLEYVSKRLLENYNDKNGTDFDYYQVVRNNYNVLLNSGIMTVLTKKHIPEVISKEFEEKFPQNPKDEYPKARRIDRKFFIHLGDTNTGKTYNAMKRLKEAKEGVYLSPLRILALENYERLNEEGVVCNLSTGEEEIIHLNATHTSCTIEKLNLSKEYDIAIIDEIQMIEDLQRGAAWTRALLGLKCKEIHICGALNAKEIILKIIEDCKDEYEIKEYKRSIPLEIEYKNFVHNDIKKGDALVAFSKKRVLQIAESYSKEGVKASIIYGDLPPEVRRMQYKLFIEGENKILVTTDAIGMGVNLPIRRIVFMDTRKYDGEEVRELKSQEVKQIAGRAGRIGIYEVGYVASARGDSKFLKERIKEEDIVIEKAVLAPTEKILDIKNLPLNEKLALWSSRKEKTNLYKKMDINDYLYLLDNIKRFKLEERIQWELLKVPFDTSKDALMEAFLDYVYKIFVKKEEISKPENYTGMLDELELYYQKISMYYSFGKIFKLPIDLKWINEERLRVSEEINELLLRI